MNRNETIRNGQGRKPRKHQVKCFAIIKVAALFEKDAEFSGRATRLGHLPRTNSRFVIDKMGFGI
jgi:hypothetical protein